MEFVWYGKKNTRNVQKHCVSFEEALTAFYDLLSSTIPDLTHSVEESRFLLIGMSAKGRLLVVVHIYCGEIVRIISARVATKRERRTYEET